MAGSLELHLELEGDQRIRHLLGELSLTVRDLRGAMNAVGNEMTAYFSGQVFASRGRVINEPWQKLNDNYAARKARQFPGRPPLVQTGQMQRSFRHKAGNMSVTISNTDPKFPFHQSSAPRGRMPRRPMIGVNARMQDRVTNVIATVLADKVRQAR